MPHESTGRPVRMTQGAHRTLLALLLAAGLYGAPHAALACPVYLDEARVNWSDGIGRYDPFSGAELGAELEALVRRAGSVPRPQGERDRVPEIAASTFSTASDTSDTILGCEATLHVESTGTMALRGARGTLAYRLDGLTGDTLASIARLAPGESVRLKVGLTLPAGQQVEAGRYADTLTLRLLAGTPALQAAPAHATPSGHGLSLPLEVGVDSAASLDFIGTSGRATFVDLGLLESGTTTRLPVSLSIRSTAAYDLSFRSENGGMLQLTTNEERWSVPYSLKVGGQRVPLESGAPSLPGNATDANGERLLLDFTVGDVGRARAGRYTDRIRIDILPLGLSPR